MDSEDIIGPSPWLSDDVFDRACRAVDEFVDRYPEQEYGPAHVILSDYNFDDEFFETIIPRCNDITAAFLRRLRAEISEGNNNA